MRVRIRLEAALQGWVHLAAGDLVSPAALLPFHRHIGYEINLVVRGRGIYLFRNKRYVLEPGVLLWIFPNEEHCLADLSDDFEMWVVLFREGLVRRTADRVRDAFLFADAATFQACKRLGAADLRALDMLIRQAAGIPGGNPARFNAALRYILETGYDHFRRTDSGASSNPLHPSVRKAMDWMNLPQEDESVDAIARAAGLSRSRLSHLFREQTGVTLVDYRNRCRLDRFLRLAGPEGRSVNLMHAALQAGFGSYPQFHRVFSRIMGHAPARMKHRE